MKRKARTSGAVLRRARAERERAAPLAGAAAVSLRIEELAYQAYVARGRDAAGLADDWIAAERALTLGHEPVSID